MTVHIGRQSGVSPAAKIALIYLAFSVLWIALSDRAVEAVTPDAATISGVQTAKGLLFVVLSALLLFAMTRRYLQIAERTTQQLSDAYDQTLEGWAAALDVRDHSTGEHTARVTELTVALAERFGIAGEDLDDIRRGATLHDIGKMAIPDAILGKTEPLTSDEWSLMMQHPDVARSMLKGIAFLESAIDIPWCHHERWDGTGYPRGLSGMDIPLGARLFAVVDVYDAMSSDRPYHQPVSFDEARRTSRRAREGTSTRRSPRSSSR